MFDEMKGHVMATGNLRAGRPSATRAPQSIEDMMSDSSGRTKRIQVNVDADLHRRFKEYAVRNETAMQDLLIKHIHQLLEDEQK